MKIISPTESTPAVVLDSRGIIKFSGRLIPENALQFFLPIEEWFDEYFKNPGLITTIEISLEYINSAGTKYLLNIIHKIVIVHHKNNKNEFVINWYYDDRDEDMLEKGMFFSSLLKAPFNFIKITG